MLSGYGSIATNVVCTMFSVPLALHYLDKGHFGLWALATQISGYLALIDLGMSGAICRFLADHKDDVQGEDYGKHLTTGGLVFLVQGLFVAVGGMAISPFAAAIFAVPPSMAAEFRNLLMVLTASTGFSVAMRSLAAPLWPFQRNDVIYACASLTQFITLGLLWVGFHLGWGVMSFAIAQIPPLFGTIATYVWVCHRNHYFPPLRNLGRPSMSVFVHIFQFGKDNLMVILGSQLVNATQIMIISRTIGLDAAATFSIATKLYGMAQQVFSKVIEIAAPGLTELVTRGEFPRFIRLYWDAIAVTQALATLGAVALAAGNAAFIVLWTGNTISWSLTGDFLLGFLVVTTSLSRCFISLFGMTKDLRQVRIIYFVEGLVFVPCAIVGAHWFGLEGVLGASLVAHLSITLLSSARAASKVLGSCKPVLSGLLVSLALTVVGTIVAWAGLAFHLQASVRLGVCLLPILASAALIWFYTVPNEIRQRISSVLALRARRLRHPFRNA